jgi:hypothetical protein
MEKLYTPLFFRDGYVYFGCGRYPKKIADAMTSMSYYHNKYKHLNRIFTGNTPRLKWQVAYANH